MKSVLTVLCAVLAIGPSANAHTPEAIADARLAQICAAGSLSPAQCAQAASVVHDAFEGLGRTGGGVSYDDARNENDPANDYIEVSVGAFYFEPRVLEVDPGQVVHFHNIGPLGGNPHQVNSSDWLLANRALPVPGSLSFGGGTISSGRLQPQETWDWSLEPTGNPGVAIPLGIDKVLIPYHCNVHGASQMNGFLILRTKQY